MSKLFETLGKYKLTVCAYSRAVSPRGAVNLFSAGGSVMKLFSLMGTEREHALRKQSDSSKAMSRKIRMFILLSLIAAQKSLRG